ncbi:MAG: YfhO family protein, partial [Chloroflexi bacterium]|nr:YfhO family protein [Chloroflexota bacterium]
MVFARRILTSYDLFTYTYPYKDFTAASLRSGHIPLWNPYLFFGVPFFANIQTAVLYPINVLTSYMGAPQAAGLSIVLHIFLAGAGMYAFTRLSVGLGRAGSFLAALAFMFSGFLTAQVGHLNQITVSVWLPLLLLCFEQAYRRRSLRLALAMALVVTLQALAGGPQQLYLSLVALGLFVVFVIGRRAFQRPLPLRQTLLGAVGALLLFGFGVGLGLGLAAIQLLPSLELSRWSIRGGGLGYTGATSFSLPPPDLLRALLPGFTSNPFSEYVAYVGAVALFLVLVALVVRRRHPYTLLCLVLVVAGLLLAMGKFTPLYELAYRHVPGFDRFRVPARWLYLYSFGVSVLAGLGLSALEERGWLSGTHRWKPMVRILPPVLALALAAFVAIWVTRQKLTIPSSGIAAAWAAGAGAGFLVLLLATAWPKGRQWGPVLL